MKRSYHDYRAIVGFLMSDRKISLEEAIASAKVPAELVPNIVAEFSKSLEILKPSVLEGAPSDSTLIDPEDPERDMHFSSTLKRFLGDKENGRGRDAEVVENIMAVSRDLVRRLPDPLRNKAFQHRGMVIGHIQSGKTASMAALIAAAADHGYKLIVVFAGLYKDLRAQTQRRLDQEITGQSENISDWPLVKAEPGALEWVRLTASGLDTDFQPGPPDVSLDRPKLAVIKKNHRVLDRFNGWLSRLGKTTSSLPALIIDDEADLASINTKSGKTDEDGDPVDPARTNDCIRSMLKLLPKHVYVGYTATPFANVLIDRNEAEDLYPKHFIACLPEPRNYLGPRQLFGLGMSPSTVSPQGVEAPALSLLRTISADQIINMQTMHSESQCPEILEDALLTFILASCARIERGQGGEHFSMFIHPSYATDRQEVFESVVRRHLTTLIEGISRPKLFPNILERASHIWKSDFCQTTRALDISLVEDFKKIWNHATSVANDIRIKLLNSRSDDALDYRPSDPKRYIIIGGQRLSRGLTIEGLMVSVFLRDTNTYDALLQMGRWFGYRPGYLDLTRIFMEEDVADKFQDLARIELELREDLEKYSEEPNPPTPMDAAPRIRSHPIMLVTARNKMGAGKADVMTLAGRPRETVTFPVENIEFIRNNLRQTVQFIANLGKPDTVSSGAYYWKGRPPTEVLSFIRPGNYIFSEFAQVVNSKILSNYIKAMNENGELQEWDIILPAGNPDCSEMQWTSKVKTNRVIRQPRTQRSIGVLRSPNDLQKWQKVLGRNANDPAVGAIFLYLIDKDCKNPSGMTFFPAGAASEDIVGLVLSFPHPTRYIPVTYITQEGET